MAERGKGNIGILGLSYKRDLKVHTLSPVLGIVRKLRWLGADVKVFDPYYNSEEIQRLAGVDSFEYPEGLSQFGGIIIVPPHRLFGQTPKNVLFSHLKAGQAVLDNEGIWGKWRDDFVASGINYHRVGDKGWCLA
jgi:UDP-N-acetyl-D-mannosaminuronate dehydrogenase